MNACPFGRLHLTSVPFNGQCQVQGHSVFEDISYEGTELGYLLLFKTSMKSHMSSPAAPSHLTLSDLERSTSSSRIF